MWLQLIHLLTGILDVERKTVLTAFLFCIYLQQFCIQHLIFCNTIRATGEETYLLRPAI